MLWDFLIREALFKGEKEKDESRRGSSQTIILFLDNESINFLWVPLKRISIKGGKQDGTSLTSCLWI